MSSSEDLRRIDGSSSEDLRGPVQSQARRKRARINPTQIQSEVFAVAFFGDSSGRHVSNHGVVTTGVGSSSVTPAFM